ncbi:MAG: flagellar basal body P-ring protein FlgI [Proteobacteria bacterium]|nr:flagellar basal body P-ring protein FlgI [Pseudomonadota bacterium]
MRAELALTALALGLVAPLAGVALGQGGVSVRITETPEVSQPGPFAARGRTVVVPRTTIEVEAGGRGRLVVIPGTLTIKELVRELDALGLTPEEKAEALRAIARAGALQAK